ncbi:RNA guanine-N7 methyltransferase activating subunit [Parasteatoda tepidariorum]|uniref:RNA guanine-N7 methyltransferase activating subunit n=1 Tax=Parasteatoda tepidariorum TaxID=114398 RepID=UPI00077F810B|nr:RNA guanine-N7 methyltransferase activating subunit [Parasteatoda tepidariorum]
METSVETLPNEETLEELFKDRFTANDSKYVEVQSRKLPLPPVVHPWRVPGRIFHKKWDYSSSSQDHGRSRHDRDHHRSHSYRDRSEDGDRNRRERGDSSNRNWNERNRDREGSTSHNRDERTHNERNRYR